MPDIEIKRGYEVLPDNNVRFGIRVINNSDFAISEVEILLDYSESLFELSGNKVHKLGTIPPAVPRTAKFILKPLSCIHKENIGATIIYKDHQWKKHTIEMNPKEVHCVCPFLKEKSIKRADFLTLSKSGFFEERGVNFEGITVDKLVEFISHTCKNRLYKVDEFPIENGVILYLAGDAVGEKAYYLLTAVVKEYEGLVQVLLRANSDKNYGLNGFLNEILDNLRHLVISASAREIGTIRKEQVINIIDSVVTRPTFEMREGIPSVDIKGSVVTRPVIKSDDQKNKQDEERLRKEKEEQERLRRKSGEEQQAQREKEEQERQRREEEALRQRQEKENQRKEREVEEQGRKAKEDKESQRKLEAGRKERELQEQRAEEERQRQIEEAARIQREKEEERLMQEKEAKSSGGKWFFGLIIILAVLALGWYGTQDSSSPATPQKTIPSVTATPVMTTKATPTTYSGLTVEVPTAGKFGTMNKPSTYESGKVKITEFLKFNCGHCYTLNSLIPALKKKYGDRLEITYKPMLWKGVKGDPAFKKSIEAYILAERMGKGEEMKDALFKAMFIENRDLTSELQLGDIGKSVGLGDEFITALKNGDATDEADANIKLSESIPVDETPTIIINGNFKVAPSMTKEDTTLMANNLDTIINSLLN